jgi:phage major head subunit gpT-like protein
MDITSQNLATLRRGFRSLYTGAFSAATPNWSRVAMEIPSTTSENIYGWMGQTTRFREWVGDRVLQNLKANDYTIKNKTFENTVTVGRETIEDDSYGVYSPLFQMLGNDASMHPDELVFPLMKAGFSQTCYDGQYFFDTDHPVLDANGSIQSVSNTGGGAGAEWFLLDVSRPVRPFIFQKRKAYNFVSKDQEADDNVFNRKEFVYGVDARVNAGFALWQMAYGSRQPLDAANYQAARTALLSMKGDNGRPLNIMPNLLVVGPSLEKNAKEIIEAERNAAGATNIYRGTAQILMTPYLT